MHLGKTTPRKARDGPLNLNTWAGQSSSGTNRADYLETALKRLKRRGASFSNGAMRRGG